MAGSLTSTREAAGASRVFPVAAAMAGLVSAVSVLLACLAVGLGGWLASGAADHGSTGDALRVGADAWLLAHGAHLQVPDAHVTVVPLGLTALCALVCNRAGRWVRVGGAGALAGWLAAVVMATTYGAVAATTAVAASTGAVRPSPGLAFVGAFVLALLAGGSGMLWGSGRPWRSRLPRPAAAAATGAAAATLLTVAASALVLAGCLLRGFGAAANVLAGLHVDTAGGLFYTLVLACVAPNAALLTAGYLLGPGFQVGVGTVVSPTAVSLGPLPAFPVLAALPGAGPTPWWTLLLMGVPVLAAAAAAVLVVRRYDVRGPEQGALRGLLSGVGGGLLTAVLVAVAGGSVGPGRMSEVGASLAAVLPAAALSMGVGGALGGLLGGWWRRAR